MVYGVSDAQVSGYLAAWVPVGANDSQDARTESSTTASTDGNTYHSNSALDSQLIYEGFSNFKPCQHRPMSIPISRLPKMHNYSRALG